MEKQTTIETCPKCGGVGKPIAVTSQLDKVLVTFRCPYCQTEWETVRPEEKAN